MSMRVFDFSTPKGQQDFQQFITALIRNEVNSYIQQVLFERNATNITTPTTSDTNPLTGAAYTTAEIQDYRLDRLEQATFRR
jgi:hypothetical protein